MDTTLNTTRPSVSEITDDTMELTRPHTQDEILRDPRLLNDLLHKAQTISESELKKLHGIVDGSVASAATAPTWQGSGKNSRRPAAALNAKEQTAMNVTTPAKPNSITLADMIAVAEDLGKQSAMGVDVQIKMDLKVLEASFQGSLDLSANKHGQDVDDATKLGEAYYKARNGAVIFDAKAPNQRKLVSNLRKAIKLGGWSKGGPGEPLSTVNNLMNLRQGLKKKATKNLDDAHNTFMRFATEQLRRDSVVGDAELEAFCYRPGKNVQTVEDFYEALRKRMTKVRDGKGDVHDTGPVVDSIIQCCTNRLTQIAKAKGGQVTAVPATPPKATP